MSPRVFILPASAVNPYELVLKGEPFRITDILGASCKTQQNLHLGDIRGTEDLEKPGFRPPD
jgi:hypothetical protein